MLIDLYFFLTNGNNLHIYVYNRFIFKYHNYSYFFLQKKKKYKQIINKVMKLFALHSFLMDNI